MADPLLDVRIRQDAAARNSLYGLAPVNPFEELRLSQAFSYLELARASHIDVMAVKRAEWGTYAQPLPSLADYWVRRNKIAYYDLTDQYTDFVTKQRARHKHYFGPNLVTDPNLPLHPFRQLRERRPSLHDGLPLPVGLVECAKAICAPLDTIQFFEKKATQKSVPATIKAALHSLGYSTTQVRLFSDSYAKWREIKLGQVQFS